MQADPDADRTQLAKDRGVARRRAIVGQRGAHGIEEGQSGGLAERPGSAHDALGPRGPPGQPTAAVAGQRDQRVAILDLMGSGQVPSSGYERAPDDPRTRVGRANAPHPPRGAAVEARAGDQEGAALLAGRARAHVGIDVGIWVQELKREVAMVRDRGNVQDERGGAEIEMGECVEGVVVGLNNHPLARISQDPRVAELVDRGIADRIGHGDARLRRGDAVELHQGDGVRIGVQRDLAGG